MKLHHITWIALLLGALIWLLWPDSAPRHQAAPRQASAGRQTQATSGSHAEAHDSGTRQTETIHSKLGGDITLRNGESCIFSYFGNTPGKATIVEITPILDDAGLIRTSMKIVEVADRAPDHEIRSELLPDIFDFQHLSALAPADTSRFHAELAKSDSKVISYPSMVSRPGKPSSLRSLVIHEDGTRLGGFTMSVTINNVSDGFHLATSLDLYSQRHSNTEDD